jgi:transposase
MLYLGLDVHGKWTTIVGFDPQSGQTVRLDRVSNEPEAMQAALGALPGPVCGVLEAGTNSWAVYRQLEPLFERLVVAHPADLWDRRRDPEAKTDRRDALRMAQKLYRGEIRALYVPDVRTQDLRCLVRGKVRASRWVTKLTNEIGSLLRSWGYVGKRSLLSKRGMKDLDQARLPGRSARILALWRQMLSTAQAIENELEQQVAQEARAEPECALLQTVPQVGPFTALLVRAEIGEIARFSGPKALAKYAGLVPKVKQSGEKCRYGPLSPWGNRWLRYALVLWANRIARSRSDSRLRRFYWRRSLAGGKSNPAKIATARKAIQVIYHLLRRGEAWQESFSQEERAGQVA